MNNSASVFRVDGKIAVIVGAGSGIGQAAAIALAQSGATVVCADVNSQSAEGTRDQITKGGGKASALKLDIRDKESVHSGVDSIRSSHGKVDILVATPAVNVRKRLLSYTDEELDRVVDLNLKGSFRITQAVAQLMGVNGSGGSIILTSSIRSLVVEPGQGVYAATKASLVQLARGFAVELAPKGIRVNAVAPGVVDTALTAPIKNNQDWYSAYANHSALKRWASAEELAWPIVFLASPASSYITGTVLFVDGGWTAIDGRFEPPL
jgi:NAD(P)-dependent dehydrogenase (short-subunit alcohol dehydrogenase family)